MEKETAYNPNLETESPEGGINAKELLLKYLHYSWLFALTLILALTVAWLYLRYSKPIYSVSSTLLIRNDNAKGGASLSSQDMFSDIALFQSITNKQNEILILTSRTMMERVVKSLGLQVNYGVVGNVKTTNIYQEQPFEIKILHLQDSSVAFGYEVHFDNDWKKFRLGEGKKEWLVGEEIQTSHGSFKLVLIESPYTGLPFRDFYVSWSPLRRSAMSYLGGLDIKPANDQSNVLRLSFVNENPKLATAILNELMVQYNNAAIEDKNEINRKILTFINDRLNLVETQLDSVEGNLQRFRTSRQVIDLPAQSTMYFENVTQLTQTKREQEIQLQVAQLLEDYLNRPQNKLSLVPSTLGLQDPTLLSLVTSYNELVTRRLAEVQTGATPGNPVVQNIEKAIEEARVKMLQNLINIKRVYQNNINNLTNESNSLKKEITSIPEKEKQSREKARQQEIKQNLYLYLMQKREESEIAQASTIASSRIIDTALPTFNLVSPLPLKVYSIGLLIGLLLPIIIIYVRDILNDKVTTSADITKVTSAPILGEIGHSDEEKVLLFPRNSRTIVAEQMRILRSNLQYLLGDRNSMPTIMVTSSFSGEGKSFISTNLGATLAISGKRTVILEFDLRKPKILAGLGLPKGHGLTNYLVGSSSIQELAQAVPQVENLYVIPSGPVPPNPSEILLTPKVGELFNWLKEHFDAIVIDTAPVGLVSDAFTLSLYSDATIYVIRQRYTFKRQVNFINDLYFQRKLPNMGLLVNDVITEGRKSYYGYGGGRYGYAYSYGYGYGASYFEENIKRKTGLLNNIKRFFS